jgi:DNA mismatch repair protein MutS2
LLDRRLRERGSACVPAALAVDPADCVLVISGPNTGGKTVVLKTVGLAVLAAQSGIPVPAGEAELPLFRQVRADIGDHQSIQADLSTYSAHVRAIAGFLQGCAAPALMLFDEIGTGTEPAEGGALAQAILEALIGTGNTALATTHLGVLKTWAATTKGAVSAAMEIDAATLSPTYRIVVGRAGVSAGLEIAERLGLSREIVERARARLDPATRRSEDYLRQLHRALAEAEEARARAAQREAELEERQRRFEERMEREAQARSGEASQALDRELAQFRRAARKELASLTDPGQREAFERRLQRAERRVGSELARGKAALRPRGAAEPEGEWVEPRELGPGMQVLVVSLGKQGEVVEAGAEEVRVALGGMAVRVPRSEIRVAAARAADTRPPRRGQTAEVRVPARDAPREVVLVGRRVDEALEELDRFLDGARLAGHAEVRIVHGHGTGRLRKAVRQFLAGHAEVADQRPGQPHEGGEGATVARLR